MDFEGLGNWFRESVLSLAKIVVADHWPGILSLFLVAAMILIALHLGHVTKARIAALSRAMKATRRAQRVNMQGIDLAELADSLSKRTDRYSKSLANAFAEFRETLLVGRGDDMTVRNSIRPSAFINVDDMGFSLRAWRFVPGLFVSTGLLLTFLGLIAVLTFTADGLVAGAGTEAVNQIGALQQLLKMASAKFIISLTGLFCSILLNIWLNILSRRIDARAEELTEELENSMSFISLEGLAEKQLRATRDQSENLKAVVTELVAELGKSIDRAAERSERSLEKMVQGVGSNISSGIGGSLERAAQRVEEASKALGAVGESLSSAAHQFDSALAKSTESLKGILEGLVAVSGRLTLAADSLAEASPQVIETLREGNTHTLRVAEGAAEMVNAAKTAISEEKTVVLEAMRSIEALMRAFEHRAAAYDGQLEKAFGVYQTQVAETLGRLEAHGADVQKRFGDALATLTVVIQNAKAFEPESRPPVEPKPEPPTAAEPDRHAGPEPEEAMP